MRLFDDVIVLEFQKDEWEKFRSEKSIIITPDTVKEKEEGKMQQRVLPQFFKVVSLGEGCTGKVKVGDRLLGLKPPTLQRQPQINPTVFVENGKEVVKYTTYEQDVLGVE